MSRAAATPAAGPLFTLQRAAGNQALLGLLQRKSGGKGKPAAKGQPKKPKVPAVKNPEDLAVTAAAPPESTKRLAADVAFRVALAFTGQTGDKGSRISPIAVLRSNWYLVAELLTDPDKLREAPGKDYALLEALFKPPSLADQLEALSPEDRRAVAGEVERGVLALHQQMPVDTLAAEYSQLHSNFTGNLAQGFLGWAAMRQGVLRCFGDIQHLNDYYRALVPAGFPSTNVHGNDTLVHPKMKERLDGARMLIEQRGWMPLVEKSIKGVWATNIRNNSAAPGKLGEHALGWAMDIDPVWNPDIRPFPPQFKDVIGEDAGLGPPVKALRDPKISTEEAIESAGELRDMSDRIVAAFKDQASIVAAIAAYLQREGAAPISGDDRAELTRLLEKAGSAKGKKESAQAVEEVTHWILVKQDQKRADAEGESVLEQELEACIQVVPKKASPWVVRMTAALGGVSTSEKELEELWKLVEKQIDSPTTSAPREAARLRARLLYSKASVKVLNALNDEGRYDSKQNLRRNLEQRLHQAMASRAAGRALQIYKIFLAAEVARPKKPLVHSTPGVVAAHGFLRLPPEFVGAMVSNEGGALHWLGCMEGKKDSMHFELRRNADRPDLPGGPFSECSKAPPEPSPIKLEPPGPEAVKGEVET